MKTYTLDASRRRADEVASHTSSALIGAIWLIARVSEYRKRRAHERTLHSLKRNIGEIPTHLLEDIGIDEYQAAEILAKATRNNRVLTYPFLQLKG